MDKPSVILTEDDMVGLYTLLLRLKQDSKDKSPHFEFTDVWLNYLEEHAPVLAEHRKHKNG